MPMDPSSVHPDNVESGKINNFYSLLYVDETWMWILKWNRIILSKLFLKPCFTFIRRTKKIRDP